MASSNNRDPSQEDELPFPNFSEEARAHLTARDIQLHDIINERYATATDRQTFDQVYRDECQLYETIYDRLRKEEATKWRRSPTLPQRYHRRDPDDPLDIYHQRSKSLPPTQRSQTPPPVDRFSGYATPESSDDEDDDEDSLDDNFDDHIYPPHLASLMKPSPYYGILPSPPSITVPGCRFCDEEDHHTLEERTECYNNYLTEEIKNYNDYVPPPAKNSSAPANVPARSQ
jgi:hypothetical protein